MEYLIQNRDPLFSLIIFVGLIFIISFFSYVWAMGRSKKQKESLESFFAKFRNDANEGIDELLRPNDSKEALLLLAQAYTKSGDYEKAIAIYTHLKDRFDQKDILLELAKLYSKAGFLARSMAMHEEILRFFPRDRKALRNLLLLYEKMGKLQDALAVGEILEELGESGLNRAYIQALIAIKESDTRRLLQLYNDHPKLLRPIFEYLFREDYILAWRHLQPGDYVKIVDILWYLPKEKIQTDDPFLQEIYSAKGYVDMVRESQIFAFDLLLHYPKAELEFEYVCTSCKSTYPFAFYRCTQCASIGSCEVEMIITQKKRSDEENYTF